ncbi:hypothetical protein PVL29_016293 [Vitis rotundifolia]|uniref:Uncharacterized protein n=1 Tax=Vitis rotundifolia TaxID=103349 RepID=A0AA38ZFP6_VITRO|nr:hypothetical protein PVL29_016293 [Vitis rotundifolia]
MPKILTLMIMQRQTAASRSTRLSRRLQHGVLARVPTPRCTKSFNKPAHTPNFRVSTEQVDVAAELLWRKRLGFSLGCGQRTWLELTKVKKRRLRDMRRPVDAITFEAILKNTR